MRRNLLKRGRPWIAGTVVLTLITALPLSPASVPNTTANITTLEGRNFSPSYHWAKTPIANGAELLTLMGRFDAPVTGSLQEDVPLVSILRDSLPNGDSTTDRLRYLWVLPYQPPNLGQKILSAVPFFFWSLGAGGGPADWSKLPGPLVDLSQPEHRVWKAVGQSLVQWSTLDPMTTPVRASSRVYRNNGTDQERLHVEAALTFLRLAPAKNDGSGLSQEELNKVIGRLSLSKTMLGGLVPDKRLAGVAGNRDILRTEVVGRNWELLRTSAERTGLLFEPLSLVGGSEDYAVLWMPLNQSFSAPGLSLTESWKLLHISDPWTDARFRGWKGYQQVRCLDADGRLLPQGETGPRQVTLAPLAVYSLTYPRSPLLMVDFRSSFKPKRHELVQRSSDQLVMGVLGLSRIANWYYFAGNAAYTFVRARHGSAEDRSQRLDSYAGFRVGLALSKGIDPAFRKELISRTTGLAVNPLEVQVQREIDAARHNFELLESAAADPENLPMRVDKKRREELAAARSGRSRRVAGTTAHILSFGAYTRRAAASVDTNDQLVRVRRTQALTRYVEQVASAGARPEVQYSAAQIGQSIAELSNLLGEPIDNAVKRRAENAITAILEQTRDANLAADCRRILASLPTRPSGVKIADSTTAPATSTKAGGQIYETTDGTR